MRRPAAIAALATLALSASSVGASGVERKLVFAASLRGTVTKEWGFTAEPVPDGACLRTDSGEGTRLLAFATRHPTLVTVRSTRGRPRVAGTIRPIAGRVTTSGSSTSTTDCGGERSGVHVDCALGIARFAHAVASFANDRPRSLRFGRMRGLPRPRVSTCPPEPAAVAARQPGIELAPAKLAEAKLLHPRLKLVVIRGTYSRDETLAGYKTGHVSERVVWTLTLRRVTQRPR